MREFFQALFDLEFFKALFDLQFRRFITIRVIGSFYALALVVMAVILLVLGLVLGAGGFKEGFLQGLIQLFFLLFFLAWGFLLFAIGLRILLEAVVALVRVAENTGLMVEEMRKKG